MQARNKTTRYSDDGYSRVIIIAVVSSAVLLVLMLCLVAAGRHKSAKTAAALTGCVTRTLAQGSSGSCVKDVQTFVNFVETDDLSECPFTGGKTINESGMFDSSTARQVAIVQTWLNCYNRQEGEAAVVNSNGIVAPATWSQLCNYAYRFPSQSSSRVSPYAKASIAAGKNAGCAELVR